MCGIVPNLFGNLIGTVPTAPGTTVPPGLVSPFATPGTLLATLVAPFSFTTAAGTTSGSVSSAVFLEPTGTLDFYYQIANNASSASPIARETDISFTGFLTYLGFRLESRNFAIFVDGTVFPITGDRNSSGSDVGFNFGPADAQKIGPGLTSKVLVISTDATNFASGNVSVMDGGSATVASFQPLDSTQVPEPSSLALLGSGLLGVASAIRRKLAR
jgi:hypothetical protein